MTKGDGAERGERAEGGRQHNRPVRPADEPVLRYTLFRLIFFLGTLLFIARVLVREGPRSLGIFIPDSHWFLLSRRAYTYIPYVSPAPNLRAPSLRASGTPREAAYTRVSV